MITPIKEYISSNINTQIIMKRRTRSKSKSNNKDKNIFKPKKKRKETKTTTTTNIIKKTIQKNASICKDTPTITSSFIINL